MGNHLSFAEVEAYQMMYECIYERFMNGCADDLNANRWLGCCYCSLHTLQHSVWRNVAFCITKDMPVSVLYIDESRQWLFSHGDMGSSGSGLLCSALYVYLYLYGYYSSSSQEWATVAQKLVSKRLSFLLPSHRKLAWRICKWGVCLLNEDTWFSVSCIGITE